MDKIYFNKAQCKKCGSVITSESINRMVRCNCGSIAVDGGYEYIRRIGNLDDIIELSNVIDLKELKDLNDFKDLIKDLEDCEEYIDRINNDYLNNKEEALNFSDKTYKKYSISEPTITIFNSNPFPTNNDEKTQLKINLEAIKRIIVEAIIKKQKEIIKN